MFYVGEKLEVWVCKMFEMIMCLVDGIVKVCKGELMQEVVWFVYFILSNEFLFGLFGYISSVILFVVGDCFFIILILEQWKYGIFDKFFLGCVISKEVISVIVDFIKEYYGYVMCIFFWVLVEYCVMDEMCFKVCLKVLVGQF